MKTTMIVDACNTTMILKLGSFFRLPVCVRESIKIHVLEPRGVAVNRQELVKIKDKLCSYYKVVGLAVHTQ